VKIKSALAYQVLLSFQVFQHNHIEPYGEMMEKRLSFFSFHLGSHKSNFFREIVKADISALNAEVTAASE